MNKCARCKSGYYIGNNGECKKTKIRLGIRESRFKNGLNSETKMIKIWLLTFVFLMILKV